MIDANELVRAGAHLGFNRGQAEKDYLQHRFLAALSRRLRRELVFKGGTALQKAFALPRFSEDLDFTKNAAADTAALLASAAADLETAGYPTVINPLRGKGENFRLRIQGPLFSGRPVTATTIRVEVSLRNDLVREPSARDILPPYPDLPPYTLLVMAPEEILAEKTRALLSRSRARDLYDLWYLLKKGIPFDRALVDQKAEQTGPSFTPALLSQRLALLAPHWERELSPFTKFLPPFKEARALVLAAARAAKP